MKAKIKEKNEIAKLTLEVKYELLDQTINFKPGQYFFVTLLKAPYKDRGKDPTHHFTIVNIPSDKGRLSNATRLRDTAFKNSLREMKVGSGVKIGKIEGEFVLPEDITKPLCFVALGIGITPYVSMLRYIKEKNLNYKVTLIYSDSDKESMAYIHELEEFSKINPNFKIILTVTKDPEWQGEKKHVDGKFIKDHLDKPEDYLYYVSGPPKAVETVAASINKAGIEKTNIKTEDFSGY